MVRMRHARRKKEGRGAKVRVIVPYLLRQKVVVRGVCSGFQTALSIDIASERRGAG
jgi:hypothetical protein